MENQHRQIKGYRELSQEEIDLMNEIKAKGAELGKLVEKLREADGLDQRWISIEFDCALSRRMVPANAANKRRVKRVRLNLPC